MGRFNKILSSVGIGGAKVNTILSQSSGRIGESVQGIINIVGGSVEQKINKIEVELKTEYIKVVKDSKQRRRVTLTKVVVDRDLVIAAKERREIPFTFIVPDHTPVTMKKRIVWVETKLDIPLAIDPEDRDYIDIKPSYKMDTVLDAIVNILGFRLREVEYVSNRMMGHPGEFTQEFEFIPQRAFRGVLDELEITFLSSAQGIELFMQIDRRVRGFKSFMEEAAGLDESHIRINISDCDIEKGSNHVAELLQNKINGYC